MKADKIQERTISIDTIQVTLRLTPETEAEQAMLKTQGDDFNNYLSVEHNALTVIDSRHPIYTFTATRK